MEGVGAMGLRMAVVTLTVLALAAQAGCADSDDGGTEGARSTSTSGQAVATGPAAELAGPLTAGQGINLVGTRPVDLAAAGFVEEELAASGRATSYKASGELPADGHYHLEPSESAGYRTRIVVRRPRDAAAFNGTVVVEWLNVSGGLDAAPDFGYLADELLRGGYAWVGVSAQQIGVLGGGAAIAVAGAPSDGLVGGDPARYGDLHHPGDAFAYDIFTQVGRALRQPGGRAALGDLVPERLLAVGESQSAFALTTYINGVHPLAQVFDGFLVHSRGGAAAPLGEPGAPFDVVRLNGGTPARIRTDGAAPVLVLETETDLVGFLDYFPARQDDDDRFRLWEVAGTAHADAYLVGPLADLLDCGAPINAGPQQFLVRSALRHLDAWVRTGVAPPRADRFEIDDRGDAPAIVRDADGLALGGIRTPLVDVPVATLSGEPGGAASPICLLLGSTIPFTQDQLSARYPDAQAYLDAFRASADGAITAGWILPEDRAALLAEARPELVDPT